MLQQDFNSSHQTTLLVEQSMDSRAILGETKSAFGPDSILSAKYLITLVFHVPTVMLC